MLLCVVPRLVSTVDSSPCPEPLELLQRLESCGLSGTRTAHRREGHQSLVIRAPRVLAEGEAMAEENGRRKRVAGERILWN